MSEVKVKYVPEEMLFQEIDKAFAPDKGAVAMVYEIYPVDLKIRALEAKVAALYTCLDKIDWHLRTMQNNKEITMQQMGIALKVLSDNMPALKEYGHE